VKLALVKFAVSAALGFMGWYAFGTWLDEKTSCFLLCFNDAVALGFGIAVFVCVRLALIRASSPRTLIATCLVGAAIFAVPLAWLRIESAVDSRRYEIVREQRRALTTKLGETESVEDCATVVNSEDPDDDLALGLTNQWILCVERRTTDLRGYRACLAAEIDSMYPEGIEEACLNALMGFRADHAESLEQCAELHAGAEAGERTVTFAYPGFWLRCLHNLGPHDEVSRARCAAQRPPGMSAEEVGMWCAEL
jgi:hypothetical protein